MTTEENAPLLDVTDLTVSFTIPRGEAKVLAGVDFALRKREMLALVGETGSGKSITAKALLNLIPLRSKKILGQALFDGKDLLAMPEKDLASVRGRRISMVFQNPHACINPLFTLGEQLFRLIRQYLGRDIDRLAEETGISRKKAVRRIAIQKLHEVGLTDTLRLFKSYAGQISGGMAQRFMIAMALLGSPEILIADEATSALDVTVQAHILKLLKELCREKGTAILFITHDLGIAAQVCDRVAVMYSGRIVETAAARDLFRRPCHPYTRGLLAAVPKPGRTEALSFVPGAIPDIVHPPGGCRFRPRCGHALERCRSDVPVLRALPGNPGHETSCFYVEKEGACV